MVEYTTDTGMAMGKTESVQLSQRIVDAVADAEGVAPTELEPLFSALDPDALDSLFDPQLRPDAVPDATAEIRFSYHGYEVRATATGRVTLTER